METQNYTSPNHGEDAPASPQRPTRRFTRAFIFVLAALLAGAGVYYYHREEATDSELEAYSVLADNECLADYEDYITKFPEGAHINEVKVRYEELKKMYTTWREAIVGGNKRDFEMFKRNYPTSLLASQCDIKIDSLDWVDASTDGTMEAVQDYIDTHPEGRYVSDAIIVKEQLQGATANDSEKEQVSNVIHEFYDAFGANDAAGVFQCITPVMTQFLSKSGATKADVANLIDRTYTEHIQSCTFNVNNDLNIKKTTDNEGQPLYNIRFSVDQYISRDDEGKTFGSYTAEAIVNAQFQISSLKMTEVSRR